MTTRLEFLNGGGRWTCDCGKHGETVPLAPGQITATRNRLHALGEAHVKRAHPAPAIRVIEKIDHVEIMFTDKPLPGLEFVSVTADV